MNRFYFYVFLFFAAILQVALLPELKLLGVHFEILLAMTVFMGIKFDWHSGVQSGMMLGFMQDAFSTGPFGLSVLTYGIAGFLASTFEIVIFTNHVGTRLFILFLLSLLTGMATLFAGDLMQGQVRFFGLSELLELNLLSVCLVNTLFALPFYLFLDKIPSDHDAL